MARSYKRDSKGRFSSTGGGGAKGAYKEASSRLRFEKRVAEESGSSNKRNITSAKSNLTKLTNKLHGGSKPAASKTKPSAAKKPATAPKASAKPKAAAKKPDFKRKGKSAVAYSTAATSDAMARLSSGRRLKGKGKTADARAKRNLERGLANKGKKARRSEATAKRALDYLHRNAK
jgi:hypothetical protein